MIILAAILVAVLTGAVALLCAGLVTSAYVKWHRVSNFEGGAGYMIVIMALLGGLAGIVIGAVVAQFVVPETTAGFFRSLGTSCGIVVIASAVTAGVFRVQEIIQR